MPSAWLLTYDIADAGRLRRIHYRLRKRALFLQASVAVLRCPEEELMELIESALPHFEPRQDDLRAWRIDWPQDTWISGPDAHGCLLLGTAQAARPASDSGAPRRRVLFPRT